MKLFSTPYFHVNLIWFILLHFFAIAPFFLLHRNLTPCILIAIFYAFLSGFGITAGAHRLWSHRSYKANKKLQIILMILQTISFQDCVIEWARDHRCHHKFSDTDADPSNANRGFFFSHFGWLLCKRHEDALEKGKLINIKDLESNLILVFQRRFYLPLVLTLTFIIPQHFLIKIFQISLFDAFCVCCFGLTFQLHITWLTNSASHMGSCKPYDKNIKPSDSKIFGPLTLGEGWHNFHHTFPWDYKTSESRAYLNNLTNAFIDFFAWIGWATNLRVASREMIRKKVLKSGDGSHRYYF